MQTALLRIWMCIYRYIFICFSFQVFFIDYGYEKIVPVSNVRTLKASFVNDASFALKCYLSGYIPAGGNSDWTHTACEYTLEELRGKKIFYCQTGALSMRHRLFTAFFVKKKKTPINKSDIFLKFLCF